MARPTDDTTWRDLDSDEIASVASEDLHENRPNRWRGKRSTWRTLTEDERLVWQSMRTLGDRDLAAHLYNVFALKRRAKDPATAQDLVVQTVSTSAQCPAVKFSWKLMGCAGEWAGSHMDATKDVDSMAAGGGSFAS